MRLLSAKFLKDFPRSQSSSDGFAQLRLVLSTSLYYKLLDGIIEEEERKNPDLGQLQVRREVFVYLLM